MRHAADPRRLFVGLAWALAWILAAAPARAQLPAPFAEALARAGIPETQVGVVIQELGTAAPQLAHGKNQAFNPASTMKLVTTLAALDSLGPAQVWRTGVWVDGEIRGGRLLGNLILKGGGDPALTLERFWLLLREIRARGISHIQGDLILDNSLYALEPADPGAFDQSPLRAYNAPPAALLVNHNAINLRLMPRPDGLEVLLEPPVLRLASRPRLVPGNDCGDWLARLGARREGEALVLSGDYPAGCGERQAWLNLLSPEEQVGSLFRLLWQELGGSLEGVTRAAATPREARPLLEFPSPPLARLLADVNEYSNNVMAKMIYLNLGLSRQGAPATWAKGEAAVRDWLRRHGLEPAELVLENGAGLSRAERISPAALARILAFAATRPVYHDFVASLPALGLEGTLQTRLAGTPAAGRAWLKTGSLEGVRALAGYVLDDSGRRKVFVLLINHPRAGQASAAQEALLRWALSGPVAEPAQP